MRQPVLLVVDSDSASLATIGAELERRYGADYEVRTERSGEAALEAMKTLQAQGDPIALVLADQWLEGMTGAELLVRVKGVHPAARRGLLIDWGAWGDADTAAAPSRRWRSPNPAPSGYRKRSTAIRPAT